MMGPPEQGEDWAQDRHGIAADAQMLSHLAQLLQVPTPPQSRWRAATVTLFATNPLGVKGVGEAGTIGATPAVQNAVIDAVSYLGVRHIDMPLHPMRVWEAIEKAGLTRP